jgi:hypothetical protein
MQQATTSFETIAADIAQADAAIKQWTERKDYLRGLLVALNQQGEAPARFTAAGKNWTLTDGKKTWEYPEPIKEWEANLKKHKTIAQNDGSATFTLGEPYYASRDVKGGAK